jgi:iron complex transport system substrate-binding protein
MKNGWGAVTLMGAIPLAAVIWNPGDNARTAAAKPGTIQVLSDDGLVRSVRHAAGTTGVPAHPQRIAALAFADELLSLGIQPVEMTCDWSGNVDDYLRGHVQAPQLVPQVYGAGSPPMDAVAAARPDLILASVVDSHDFRQLSMLAPTVILREARIANHENRSIDALKKRLRDLGAVVGRGAEAESAIAEFDRHAAAARAAIGHSMDGKTIAFFRTRDREWRMYGAKGDNGAEAVYDVLGLHAPRMISDLGIAALDPEALAGFDVDYLIVVGDETVGARQTLNRLQRNPLWRRVTAIRENHVLEIQTYRHWISSGLLGKTRMIDEFVECIRGGAPWDR